MYRMVCYMYRVRDIQKLAFKAKKKKQTIKQLGKQWHDFPQLGHYHTKDCEGDM